MDGNKDEALRCIRIAEEAIASGNKERALRFIKIARRLNQSLQVDELLTVCEEIGSGSPSSSFDEKRAGKVESASGSVKHVDGLSGERNYSIEHVQLIRQIKTTEDYYRILGVEKTSSAEEIKRAYKKLSLKVHPDKNKAPGSDEAFKKLSKAFMCLSDDTLRRQYDHTGLVAQYEYNQQHNVRHRRRRTGHDLFEENFDPDEIFRAFFGQGNMFQTSRSYTYRTGGARSQQRTESAGGGPSLLIILLMLPFLLICLLAYMPFPEPDYALHKNLSYSIPVITEKHGVEFFVKSSDFDVRYPLGSPGRAEIENSVLRDYRNMVWRYCHVELQRRQWNKNLPTPHCEKLNNLGVA
ncbi:chaperone protein dnaJ 49 [Benincasa hispida]|uniref:chaperone protein dnaJ 49 n=1 Tax=Benincasa hispida TaxID=102211 RepID=UPI001900CC69|nr:chaperone protein dnaJ 49 [Benincasa hispida]XP_038874733.1 chaperone protein dnaJ 49 [Benincasa hispida]XP_038874734.1 chaperone protein dnaJ 49 [Benincasa hispida]